MASSVWLPTRCPYYRFTALKCLDPSSTHKGSDSASVSTRLRAAVQRKDLLVRSPVSLIVREQAMNLLLKLAIDIVQHVEAEQMIPDGILSPLG